jgi:hypothetical protein
MKYQVIIRHAGPTIRLDCASRAEAEQVRRSFITWGGIGYDITIDTVDSPVQTSV